MKKKEDTNKEKQQKIIFLSLIILLTIITFSNSLFNELVSYDDPGYIINNDLLRGLSFHNLSLIFSSFVVGNYHPLVVLSDAIVYHFFNLNPMPYHSLSLFLHLINIILVFNLVYQLTIHQSSVLRLQTSVIVACLFAIHPMHCETVCWASDMKDLLFTLFYLLSLIYYLKYLKSTVHSPQSTEKSQKSKVNLAKRSHELKTDKFFVNKTQNYQRRTTNIPKYYFICLFLFICSCLSKSAAVTLPVIMLVTDYLIRRKISIGTIVEKIPFFISSIVFGIINIYSQASNIYSQASAEANIDLSNYNIADRIFFPIYNLAYYIISSVIPYKLSAIHPYPEKTNNHLPIEFYIYAIIIFILVLSVITLISCRKRISQRKEERRYIIFGILFFLINLAFVIQIIPVGTSIVSERYTYLSYFGLFFIIGQSLSIYQFKNLKIYKFIIIMILLIFSFISYQRNKVWANNLSLFNDVIEKYPRAYIAFNNRAGAKYAIGDKQGAIEDCNKAIEINPQYAEAFCNRGYVKYDVGDKEGACLDWNKAGELGVKEAYELIEEYCK